MKKNKIGRVILLVFVSIVIVVSGAVGAYMFRQTLVKDNTFVPAKVSCEISERFDGTTKNSIIVKNTSNIDVYIRVRLVSYWVQINAQGVEEIVAKPSEMPTFTPGNGWIKGSQDTYYYTQPVGPGDNAAELLGSGMILSQSEEGYRQVIDVFAEAIQSEPEDAVENWNVTVSNRQIVNVP